MYTDTRFLTTVDDFLVVIFVAIHSVCKLHVLFLYRYVLFL